MTLIEKPIAVYEIISGEYFLYCGKEKQEVTKEELKQYKCYSRLLGQPDGLSRPDLFCSNQTLPVTAL